MAHNCSSCGAEINHSMPRCPYCGTLIAGGAEKEYMEKLHGIREDMAQLADIPAGEVKAELRRQGRRIRRIIAVAVITALLLAGIFMLQQRRWDRDLTADYIWENESFPEFSRMYEEGELEALQDPVLDAMYQDRSIWNWEYYEDYMSWLEEQGEM